MISAEYIAGYFDGEGCIRLQKIKSTTSSTGYRYHLTVVIANTHLDSLEQIRLSLPCASQIHKRKTKTKMSYVLVIQKKSEVQKFLNHIYPHIIIKKSQCDIAYEFLEIQYLADDLMLYELYCLMSAAKNDDLLNISQDNIYKLKRVLH